MKFKFLRMKNAVFFVCAVGLMAGAFAQTRTLLTPADSVSAGGKALIALDGVCTSTNTKCYNSINAPIPPNTTAAVTVVPWTSYFLGQNKCLAYSGGGQCVHDLEIQSDGAVAFVNLSPGARTSGTRALPSFNNPVRIDASIESGCGYEYMMYSVLPTGMTLTNNTPTAWTYSQTLVSQTDCGGGGGSPAGN